MMYRIVVPVYCEVILDIDADSEAEAEEVAFEVGHNHTVFRVDTSHLPEEVKHLYSVEIEGVDESLRTIRTIATGDDVQ